MICLFHIPSNRFLIISRPGADFIYSSFGNGHFKDGETLHEIDKSFNGGFPE
jgi:hypothetical protein